MITTNQYSIDGTAVKIVAKSETGKKVYIHATVTGSLYINGANTVTSATGFLIDKASGIFSTQVGPEDEIWGITSAGTHTFTVMQVFL